MKKLVYTTSEYFLDVDYPIVRELNKYYDLYWIIFMKVSDEPRFSKEEIREFSRRNNIRTEINWITSRFRSPVQLWKDLKCVLKIRRIKADIYYFQAFFDPYLPVLCKIFLKTRKIIVAIHDAIPHKKFRSSIAILSDNLNISMYKNYHFFSESQKAYFESHHPGKNIMMARLSLKDFGPAEKIHEVKKNFLFFGVIQYNKGVDYLIQAAEKLAGEYDNFTVTIAGKCQDFEPYRKMIRHPEIFRLIIKVLPNAEIAPLFVNAYYLVLPYRDVTQSGPLNIAYNYNIPVIASDFPGFREYINHDFNGYLFEPNNPEALYNVMKMTLNQSPGKFVQIKENLSDFVEKEISIKSIISKYREFFEKI